MTGSKLSGNTAIISAHIMAASVSRKNVSSGTPGAKKTSKEQGREFSNLIKVKETIQKELFPTERLVLCVAVTKSKEKDFKKKKGFTLFCVTVTSGKPVVCRIHTVKKVEKGDGFKKKNSWELSDLRKLDGHISKGEGDEEQGEFDVQLEKLYRWKTDNPTERNTVVSVLAKLSRRYIERQPEFENIPKHYLDDSSGAAERTRETGDDDTVFDPLSDIAYQVISVKEERDLNHLMADCEVAISDAEKFTETLTADLTVLDGANVHSIMASEDHVLQLMSLIDEAINEATQIEEKLNSYDDVIMVVKEEMERMKDKDDRMKVQESNYKSLTSTLAKLVSQMDFSHEYRKALKNESLSSAKGIERCTKAAEALQRCSEAEVEPALQSMTAVKDCKSRLQRLSAEFSKRLAHHMNNLIMHWPDDQKANTLKVTNSAGEPTILPHHEHHAQLQRYSGLMFWLKKADMIGFVGLQQLYCEHLRENYKNKIAIFLDTVKMKIVKDGTAKLSSVALRGSSESLQSIDPRHHTAEKNGRMLFDQLIEKTLSQLKPVCMEEQRFCINFFNIMQMETNVEEFDKQLNPEVKHLLLEIFSTLEGELQSFIAHCLKQDTFYSLSLLVHLSHHTQDAVNSGSFLSKVFGSSLVTVKRSFDDYVKALCRTFEEAKPSRKSRCGIISFVHLFEEFSEQSENIFHNSDRRSDLDKAYKVLAGSLFNEVARIASEHQKTPRHVVMMENFHRINAVLSKLKISCLDAEKADAKLRYNEHLQAYVQEQLGRPMEKLTLFFEGVDEKLKSGVKAEEVGYQVAFSKQELRKVIKEYPVKEVRKGLEALFKKVEKHLCEEESLHQVVWRSMQTNFIDQYKLFVDMLAKCYPDSNIALEFEIGDVLQMFSDIGQTH